MNPLDTKITQHFPGLVVRKDLVKVVKGNAIVPSYVLEYLLGQYCATADEASIQSGIETVREVLARHYVHRSEAGLVRSTIRERGRHKVIDKVSVDLNEKRDVYEATFSNLGIKQVLVDADTIKRHPKLLVSGVWCIADLATLMRGQERRALDSGFGQADPALQLRLRGLSGGAARLHHRRMDRPAAAEHRLQPGVVRPARQADAACAADSLLRAQLQPDRTRPKGHRQVAHLFRVLAARHPDFGG
jgi:hypothetical protein